MSLVDEVTITVEAGSGGSGARVFLSTPGSNRKRADGGTGGDGGNVFFCASTNVSDLSEFRFKKELRAENGVNGLRKNLTGAKGEDIIVLVPRGTHIIDEQGNENEIIDINTPVLLAQGGAGGIGNFDYKKRIEEFDENYYIGGKGEIKVLHLTLRLIADIGFIGLPNAGKSSLLSSLTNARPKIGSYPFTTVEPHLGVMGNLVLADIPGLIEGASKGKGLGIQFLKHIEKTKVLFHCIDSTEPDPVKTYQIVRHEFEEYESEIKDKEEIILLTKIDLVDEGEKNLRIDLLSGLGREIIPVSIYDGKSLDILKEKIEKFAE